MTRAAIPSRAPYPHAPLLAAHRQLLIASELSSLGVVRTCDLIQRWGVSYSSVSRDLSKLAERGLCERVHGGAIASRRSNGVEPASRLRH